MRLVVYSGRLARPYRQPTGKRLWLSAMDARCHVAAVTDDQRATVPGSVVRRLSAVVTMLAVAISAAVTSTDAAAEDADSFADIAEAAVHAPAVEILDDLGIIDGTECGAGRFCPTEPLKRWVMAVWITRALDMDEPGEVGSGVFSDVGDDVWWSRHVERLAGIGVTKGCAVDPARYCPDEAVTRAQIASFLTRAFDLEPSRSAAFDDIAGNVHADSIGALVAAKIAAGCSSNPDRYCPNEPVTRAQMATFLTRALGLVPSTEFIEEVEKRDIRHLVSRYTTYHACCPARVTNIQLFADKVNGAVVPPGRSFSLNGHVGERTVEDGFLEAGTLLGGELVNTVGGGVSQFATTFYNAMFWGGYRDVRHKPHSFYFSRYPEGIEATINWPDVDLVFRNDTSGYVLITTDYTDTSVTVEFYGDNDGRIVVGEWQDGRGRMRAVSEGGPRARVVTAAVSDRFDQVDPPRTLTRGNPALAYDEANRVQTARTGWTVRVTRTIDRGGSKTIQRWSVWYVPRREIIEVHPCALSGSCPDVEERSAAGSWGHIRTGGPDDP